MQTTAIHPLELPMRLKGLSAIPRYSLYSVMYYRGNILDHSKRVSALVTELSPFAQKAFGANFNPDRTKLLAEVHDDIEIIIGDIQQGNKAKMDPEELKELDEIENAAIRQLATQMPFEIDGYKYQYLLQEAHDVKTLESQFVKYIDRIDALGEALHEIYAGNICFVTNVINERGEIETPTENYIRLFKGFLNKYPDLTPLFDQVLPIPLIPEEKDFYTIAQSSNPHTPESFKTATGYLHYDFWKSVLLKHSDTIDIGKLCTQTEFAKEPI